MQCILRSYSKKLSPKQDRKRKVPTFYKIHPLLFLVLLIFCCKKLLHRLNDHIETYFFLFLFCFSSKFGELFSSCPDTIHQKKKKRNPGVRMATFLSVLGHLMLQYLKNERPSPTFILSNLEHLISEHILDFQYSYLILN